MDICEELSCSDTEEFKRFYEPFFIIQTGNVIVKKKLF